GAGAHTLHFSGTDDGPGTHTVFVFQRAFKNVGDDLHVAVRMRSEPLSGSDTVFVDHAQGPEAHVPRVVVRVEGERVVGVQPSMIRVAALVSMTNCNHDYKSIGTGRRRQPG